jgi:hypothetical protein
MLVHCIREELRAGPLDELELGLDLDSAHSDRAAE